MPTTYYFGAKNVPHRVTRVVPLEGHSQFIAKVYLCGPRGGESIGFVRADGSCKRI